MMRRVWQMLTLGMSIMSIMAMTALQAADIAEQLHDLYEAEWERSMRESPTWASSLGDERYAALWPDRSLAAIEASVQQDRQVHDQLASITPEQIAALPRQEQINYQLFRREYEMRLKLYPFNWHYVPLNQRGGIQDEGSLADSLSFTSVKDYEDWIARMRAFPVYMDQTIALMEQGIASGVIHPKIVMQRVPGQIASQIVDDPHDQLFYKPFREMPDDIQPAEQERLRELALAAVQESIVPSYRKFQTFFNGQYLPACYSGVGVWNVPNGYELYELRCQEFTTTELTPDEIHQIGLDEVKRIRKQMEEIVRQVEFKGTFAEFLEHLRTDPKFYAKDANELLRAYLELSKKVDPKLVKLFRRLPRMPYGVEAIPDYIAPDTTTAYYREPASDGTRAGTYFVNLYRPEVRPLYEIEALTLHEAVPGHHLQIALAFELDDLPNFRRYGGYTAFVEGWALYAESLGDELGLYSDPYSKFGQLTYEMWRAVRLVVDTGMHHLHWDRQKAIDFFAANTAKSLHDIENEIDRYIAWPGQALAYKIGELRIQALRKKSEERLGENFDVREFHDVILGNGAVTLDVLEGEVDAWLAEKAHP